ncbi:YciI family protein [Neobacillus notoginsengisoli]|uniref:YciI family protein n=1 Tax=Neobacillus notoginsengisoli TaxID=1578198 RepID=A0A417Z042_9BACI|nr:YciI family protein [Neobacillus notoginsengisoli]RHW43520.1 YciI family protein [Neobacillus notoginsengisoli]
MLFMLVVKASRNSEAGNLPSPELMEAMTKYNEELVKAGVRVMAKGLHPSSNGLRISYPKPGEKPVITEGPFTESKELIAGFILIDVKSREEAIGWAIRMPDPQGHGEGQIELRQVFQATE